MSDVRRAGLATVALCALVAAGCGGGTKTVTKTVTTTSTGTTTTTTTTSTTGGTAGASALPATFPAGPTRIRVLSSRAVARGVTLGDPPAVDVGFAPGGLIAGWYDAGAHAVMFAQQRGKAWSAPVKVGAPHGSKAPLSVSVAWDEGPAVVWSNPAGGGVSLARRGTHGWSDSMVLTGSFNRADATPTAGGLVVVASGLTGTRPLQETVAGSGTVNTLDTGVSQGPYRPLHLVPAGEGQVAVTWTGPGQRMNLGVFDAATGNEAGFVGSLGVTRGAGGQLAFGPDGVLHVIYGGGGKTYWRAVKGSDSRVTILQRGLQCDPGGYPVAVGFQRSAVRLMYGYGCDVGWAVYDATNHEVANGHKDNVINALSPVSSTTDGVTTVLAGPGSGNRVVVVTLG